MFHFRGPGGFLTPRPGLPSERVGQGLAQRGAVSWGRITGDELEAPLVMSG